jgi:hypothetical protein
MTTDSESASAAPAAPAAPFEVDGIHLQPSDDGATIFYIPATPIPELDPAGRPTLSVFKTSRSTSLQLGAQFDLDAATLAGLPAKIAANVPALAGARLQPAPGSVRKASVVLTDEAGVETELAASASSAFPPYTAVFAVTLSPAQAAEAISAVGGRQGVLFVDYSFQERGADAPSRKRGDVASWFHGGEGITHVRVFG